ncbi:DUF3500 domain-containing protein [Actinophytocola sp.]|uniref:DUF3500 domain-containing protein n=1 Tax=Actinophytocola sp. TaxID=1872138 RepID=UPI002D772D91|nr:DUF3500 domain-containing protein [Actinophytocola sp.]
MTLAQRMTDAALAWLDGLDDAQRAVAGLPWASDTERHRWNYTPVDHGGLPLGDLRPGQQSHAMRLVATGLSHAGYVTVSTIMGLEHVLDKVDGWPLERSGRARRRDPQLYWLRVFGEPSTAGPWSWRFGGHHVSLQYLVVGGEVAASTPGFLGADPAASPLLGGHLLRPLAAAEDLARGLVRSLDDPRAILSAVAPPDILSGNRPRVGVMATEGVPAADMSADQQEQLRALLAVYVGRLPEELAEREAAKFTGDRLGEIHFAWAGGTEPGQPHYYRLQGPRLLAEYDNTQRDVNHIHTVWRDPDNDFGDDVLARHVAEFHP